jgi:hypothetical protein
MIPMDLVNNSLTVIIGISSLGGFVYMQIKGHIDRKRAKRIIDREWSKFKYRSLCDMRKVYNE